MPGSSLLAGRQRLETIAGRDPNLRAYTELLDIAFTAAGDEAWEQVASGIAEQADANLRAAKPALQGATMLLPRRLTERLYSELRATAIRVAESSGEVSESHRQAKGPVGNGHANRQDPPEGDDPSSSGLIPEQLELSLLGASVNLEPAPQGALASILGLTALPFLQAASRACEKVVEDTGWTAGCCPICAAWPALAESRGLDRTRVLRCGRCGSGWNLPWQLCPFCANDDHSTLAYLYEEGSGEARRVFTCERCHGFLKTIATVVPIDPLLVPVEDLETLTLDLVAIDAGFDRPAEPGVELNVALRWSA